MKNIALSLGILALFMPLASEALSPGESIVRDANGDYIITYATAPGRLVHSRFVPATKIDPTLRSRFENQHGSIRYRFSIKNGPNGKQPLIMLIFDPISSIRSNATLPETWQERDRMMLQLENDPVRLEQMLNEVNSAVETPNGWSCEVLPTIETGRSGFRIPCSFDDLDDEKRNGLQRGSTLAGFGFSSMDLPGIGVGKLMGHGDLGPVVVDGGPDGEISDQLEALQLNDYVPRNAAVPTIPVPEPFDAAVMLERIQAHAHTWIALQLLDPTFAAQLDRYFQSAISAYRLNQTKVGKEHIQTLRKLIKKEQPDADKEDDERNGKEDDEHNEKGDDADKTGTKRPLIDKLAARILDFDLKYVTKRAGGDKDD